MSFLFVDRITRMDEGRFIQGIKQITLSDTYLCSSWNDTENPNKKNALNNGNHSVLMSSIIGETLGQLGAWCVMHANGFTGRPVAGVVSAVHIHDEAKVGEQLFLETTIDALDEAAVEYHSIATVDGRPIFTIESALGPILPMEDFIDPKVVKAQFEKIYRLDLDGLSLKNIKKNEELENTTGVCRGVPLWAPANGQAQGLHPTNTFGYPSTHISFDKILDYNPGESIKAQKSLSLSAAYLPDHFPRKPVMPLTVLLQAKLELAAKFLQNSFEDGKLFRPITVRKVKMSGFVQPGDSVITTVKIKEKSDNQIIISYLTEMYGKRVCMAEAVFEKK